MCRQHKLGAEDDDTCGMSGRSQERTQPGQVETNDSSNFHSTNKQRSRLLLGLAHLWNMWWEGASESLARGFLRCKGWFRL